MAKLGLPELTTNQLELLSEAVETAAKKHVFSKISSKLVETLNIIVETSGEKPVTVEVEVILILSPKSVSHFQDDYALANLRMHNLVEMDL